jgi:hypothetical protein
MMALCFAGSAAADAAFAQMAKEESVVGRPRPEYEPLGIELDEILGRAGLLDKKAVEEKRSPFASFIVRPAVELDVRYESNIFRTSREVATPKSDEIAHLRPAIAIASDWNNHAATLAVSGDIARHLHYQSEDFEDFRSLLGGRLDATSDLAINLDGRYEKLHEPRGTPDDLGPTAPIVNQHMAGLFGGTRYMADLLLLHFKGETKQLWFQGGDFTTHLRDRRESVVALRTGWELSPGTIAFVEPSYNMRVFDTKVDSGGLLQGSKGYRVLVGATWDVTGVTFIEAGVGWFRQEFDEPLFEPSSGPAFEGKMIWNPDPLMTISATLSRRTEETSAIGASSSLVTQAILGFDYELLDNLIFTSRLDFAHSQFTGQTDRIDKIVTGSAGFDYRIGHRWFARLSYEEIHRKSNIETFSFKDRIVSIRIGEHF